MARERSRRTSETPQVAIVLPPMNHIDVGRLESPKINLSVVKHVGFYILGVIITFDSDK